MRAFAPKRVKVFNDGIVGEMPGVANLRNLNEFVVYEFMPILFTKNVARRVPSGARVEGIRTPYERMR